MSLKALFPHIVLFFFVGWILEGGSASAADIKPPFENESTQVLPSGIRNPRFKNLVMWGDERFNDNGSLDGLGQKLNKRVSWADILAAQEDDTQRATIQGLLDSAKISEDGSPGNTTGVVSTYANIQVPVLVLGVTDRLSLAVAVPVIHVDVSADTGFIKSDDGGAFVTAATNSSPSKGQEAASKLNDAVNQKLRRLGYEPIHSMQVSGIGDVKLVAKYALWNNDRQSVAVKSDVALPTGIRPNADRALDVPTGDGQLDVGAAVIYDLKVMPNLRWNLLGGYNAQLSDTLERRLPVSYEDSLSADKERVKRNLGDQIQLGSSMTLMMPSIGVSIGGGYNFQYQMRTTFEGSAFSQERYRFLEALYPLQSLHSMMITTGFSTVDWFKQKKFFLPFQANLAYSHPLMGRNVTSSDVYAGELVMFF